MPLQDTDPTPSCGGFGLSHRNMCLLAKSFCGAGIVPVVEWVIRSKKDLRNVLKELEGYTLNLITLQLPTEVSGKENRATLTGGPTWSLSS